MQSALEDWACRQLQKAQSILEEFANDVEAVGVLDVDRDWPDLSQTYRKARAFLDQNKDK
jgi:hypothetical protein